MNQNEREDQLLRDYLLGTLEQSEQQALEARLMTDDDLFGLISIVEDELIDDYLGNKLSERERAGFESHFLSTPERQRKLSFAETLKTYVRNATAKNMRALEITSEPSTVDAAESRAAGLFRRLWQPQSAIPQLIKAGIGAAAVLTVVFVAVRLFSNSSETDKGLRALAAAYSSERPTEVRLSALSYARYSNARSGEAPRGDTNRVTLATSILLNEVAEHPTPAAHHAAGLLYLAQAKYSDAIRELNYALEAQPQNALFRSDFAAALIEMAKAGIGIDDGKSQEQFARGLENINVALEQDASLLPALFNRAICHEYMHLFKQAEEDWESYIKKDVNSQWTAEANERLKDLRERKKVSKDDEKTFQDFLSAFNFRNDGAARAIIGQSRSTRADSIADRLFDAFLSLSIAGDNAKAAAEFEALSYLARLQTENGDLYIGELLRFYDSSPLSKKRVLKRGRELMAQGNQSYNQFNPSEAIDYHQRAAALFAQSGDKWEAAYANYQRGHCLLTQYNFDSATQLFQQLSEWCEANQYRWLEAQCLNALASIFISTRELSQAIDSSTKSLRLFEEIDDKYGRLKCLNQLANEYYYLNKITTSLSLYAQSFSLADECAASPADSWRNYYSIARVFSRLGLFSVGLEYEGEALRIAIDNNLPQLICRSYGYMGSLYGNLHQYEKAIDSINRALKIGGSLDDSTARDDTIAYSTLQLANIYQEMGDSAKAIADYDRVIQIYDRTDSKYFKHLARKEKLLSCIRTQGCPDVEEEIEATIKAYEEHRTMIREDSNRTSYFEGEQNVYDVAIDFYYSIKHDPQRAFEYSEFCRARSLDDMVDSAMRFNDDKQRPDIIVDSVSKPMDLETLKTGLPENCSILQYAVLKDKLLIWLISRQGLESSSVERISLDELDSLVRKYLSLVSSETESAGEPARDLAQRLYRLLIERMEPLLEPKRLLCIVPDKVLNRLPWAALISPSSGEYLIERYELVFSPSCRMFNVASDAARKKERLKSEVLLSVGNPLFDRKVFPNLSTLTSAEYEAEAIAKFYSGTRLLVGAAATKSEVEKEAQHSDIIHLATHAIVDEWSPMRSKMLLAESGKERPSDASGGALLASEVYGLNLSRPRLIVLSACNTAFEKFQAGEGIGICRPFVVKRVPLVVASLWSVESNATARLMIDFHRHRKVDHLRTTEALRRAQRDMIRDKEHQSSPYDWAAFVTIGGYADF